MDLSRNYSLFSIPIAYVLAFGPSLYGKILAKQHMDNAVPRTFSERVKRDDAIDKRTKNRILRSQAAYENAMETLPLYMGAVISANFAGIAARTLNLFAATYLASRVLYSVTYVWLQDNRRFAPLRSLLWNVGIVSWVTLFVKAGNRLLEGSS